MFQSRQAIIIFLNISLTILLNRRLGCHVLLFLLCQISFSTVNFNVLARILFIQIVVDISVRIFQYLLL